MGKLTDALADSQHPNSLSSRARSRRWARLMQEFPDLAQMRVLDVGGTSAFWSQTPEHPLQVTVINLDAQTARQPWISTHQADACTLRLREQFDLVISNSLIEHVGGHERRQRLADVIHHHADRHWVQTPYRYFPIEPHWVAPGIQWLPLPARIAYSRYWPLGHMRPADYEEALDGVLEIELLTLTEMRHYFPASTIWKEHFAGMTKSLTAVKTSD